MTEKTSGSEHNRLAGDVVFSASSISGQGNRAKQVGPKPEPGAQKPGAGALVKRGVQAKPPAGKGAGKGAVAHRAGPRRTPPRIPMGRTQARFRFRHGVLVASFVLLVVLPSLFAAWYLHFRAADQYASNLAFTIQSDEMPSINALGALFGGGGGAAADDAEVLYGFIQSQNLVETIQNELDLRRRFNVHEDVDWWFSLGDDPSIEALTEYWRSMVLVSYNAGIVEVEVRAFTAQDAQEIAQAVLRESTTLINRLSIEAREDAVRDARQFLVETADRLRDVRLRLTELRVGEQRVDPRLDVKALMSRIAELEAALTEEQLRMDQLREFAAPNDSRVTTSERRIRSLQTAIAEERQKLASGGGALTSSVGRFEELTVDRELAEQAYAVALSSFEAAKTEARRQQRYLSAHVSPTLAQTPEYPQRWMLGGLVFVFLFMGWVVLVMIAYNIKDRR